MTPPHLIRASWPARARGRSWLARALMGAWLAVHVLVVAGAPIADAQTRHVERIVAHWEDEGERNCPPLHDPSACQLCQVASATFGGSAGTGLAPIGVVFVAVPQPREHEEVALAAALRGSPAPRGPPRV